MRYESVIRVLLVDEEDIVRRGLRSALEQDPGIAVVGEAASSIEAVSLGQRFQPDVIITEVHALAAGVLTSPKIFRTPPKVLVVTSADSDEWFLRSLRAGASGFLSKRVKPDELTQAIRVVVSGGAVISPEMTRRLFDNFDIRLPFESLRFETTDPLSHRELDVLRRIANGRSNREIATELHLSETTVKSHVSRVLRKLGLRDRLQAASLVYQQEP